MAVTDFDIQPFSVLPGLSAYSEGLDVNAAEEKKGKLINWIKIIMQS